MPGARGALVRTRRPCSSLRNQRSTCSGQPVSSVHASPGCGLVVHCSNSRQTGPSQRSRAVSPVHALQRHAASCQPDAMVRLLRFTLLASSARARSCRHCANLMYRLGRERDSPTSGCRSRTDSDWVQQPAQEYKSDSTASCGNCIRRVRQCHCSKAARCRGMLVRVEPFHFHHGLHPVR